MAWTHQLCTMLYWVCIKATHSSCDLINDTMRNLKSDTGQCVVSSTCCKLMASDKMSLWTGKAVAFSKIVAGVQHCSADKTYLRHIQRLCPTKA